MSAETFNVQFCGFGGQGIVLASVILGMTAVTKAGLEACQTQSYGSEARGGECQAQVIISRTPINSPLSQHLDLLVAMSRQASEKYLPRLRAGGTFIYDPELVPSPSTDTFNIFAVPATKLAYELGTSLAANMLMLGFLQVTTRLFTPEDLLDVVSANVPSRFREVNIAAAHRGMALASEMNAHIRVWAAEAA